MSMRTEQIDQFLMQAFAACNIHVECTSCTGSGIFSIMLKDVSPSPTLQWAPPPRTPPRVTTLSSATFAIGSDASAHDPLSRGGGMHAPENKIRRPRLLQDNRGVLKDPAQCGGGSSRGNAEKNKRILKDLVNELESKRSRLSISDYRFTTEIPTRPAPSTFASHAERTNQNRRNIYAYNKACIAWYRHEIEKLDVLLKEDASRCRSR